MDRKHPALLQSVSSLFILFFIVAAGAKIPIFPLYFPQLVTKTASLIFYRPGKLSCPAGNYIVKRQEFQCSRRSALSLRAFKQSTDCEE